MAYVDPTNRTRFRNSFHAAADDISKSFSTSLSAAADEHWAKWAAF